MNLKLPIKFVSMLALGCVFSLTGLKGVNHLYVTPSKAYHIVQKGESIESISQQYAISVANLKSYNQLADEQLIEGQKLYFTPPKNEHRSYYVTRAVMPRSGFHVVEEGQDLEWISQRYNIDIVDLLDFNHLADLKVDIGQKIWLEDGHLDPTPIVKITPEVLEHVRPSLIPTSPAPMVPVVVPGMVETTIFDNPTNSPFFADTTAAPMETPRYTKTVPAKYHVVKRGETLSKIAQKYRMPVKTLKSMNGMRSNTRLKPGQRLLISKSVDIPTHEAPTLVKTPNGLVMPVAGKAVSEFGWRGKRPHQGIDLAAPMGTPIYAALDGKVAFVGRQRGYGNVIILEHADSVMTVYGHNDVNLVRLGDAVTAGQPIAKVGHTGNAKCSHLHFEYRVNGKAINPRIVLPSEALNPAPVKTK